MGNRAVIEMEGENIGIYLHWNGGLDTVQPVLDVAKEYGIRGGDYGIARLAQIFGNAFDGTLGIGVAQADKLHRDNHDNGTYIINQQLDIIGRLFHHYGDTDVLKPEQQSHDYENMKAHIKNANDQFFINVED